MITPKFLKNKNVAVLGLGVTGLATCDALKRADANFCCWDDHDKARMTAKEKGYTLTNLHELDFSTLDVLLWSPGVPSLYPDQHPIAKKAQEHDVQIYSDIDLLAMTQPDASYIGITGTNGKSTTTALIAYILENSGYEIACGGNLGTAVMDLPALGKNGYYIIELSSYQLEITSHLKADIAILLNISEDHLKHHGSMKNYIAAKEKLFSFMKANGTAIIGVDDPDSEKLYQKYASKKFPKRIYPLCVNNPMPVMPRLTQGWLCDQYNQTPASTDLNTLETLKGSHNHQNALAAYIACREIGLSAPEIIHHIHAFPGLPHRQQFISKINRVNIINDSKATNPDAASKALSCYENIYWLVGGIAKSDDPHSIDCLKPFFKNIKHVYLYGDAAKLYENFFKDDLKTSLYETLDSAFQNATNDALKAAEPSSTVLLSPACASFDQFQNFAKRGDHFISLTKNFTDFQNETGVIYD